MESKIAPHTVIGDLELVRPIGYGGEAEVWEAKEITAPHDIVAAKIIAIPYAERERQKNVDRIKNILERELKNWNQFRYSRNTVILLGGVEGIVKGKDGEDLIIIGCKMELSTLGDLSKFLGGDHLQFSGKKELRIFLLDIAMSLRAAHDVNVAHRDIKPQNILLFRDAQSLVPKMMDFGQSISSPLSTNRGGTPEYMAPEQFEGEKSISLDDAKKSDIYSLGLLFYHVVYDIPPFLVNWETQSERMNKYAKAHQNMEIDFNRESIDSDEGMARLLKRMTAKDATYRPSIHRVIAELKRDLENITLTSLNDLPECISSRTYRWNTEVHKLLRNGLHFCFFRGSDPLSDIEWLKNNLDSKRIKGYAIYRVLGGYDYIVRVWLKTSYINSFHEIKDDFMKDKRGSSMYFEVRNVDVFQKSKKIDYDSKERLLEDMFSMSKHVLNSDLEYKSLKEKKLILSQFKLKAKPAIRFFVVIHDKARNSKVYIDMIAKDLRQALSDRKVKAREISVYSGQGDFQILIKFTLNKFLDYEPVWKVFLDHAVSLRPNAELDFQTFVEMDPSGHHESDDGSICAEVSEFAQNLGHLAV